MKTKFIVLLFMLMISFFAKAETTYRRDHTVCHYNQNNIEIDLRGYEQYAVSEDDEYGEIVFIKNKNKLTRIDLRDLGMGRYRMLKLYNDYCPKLLAIPAKANELAFFFMKDNRPSADLLIVLFYNVETRDFELVEAKLPVKGAIIKDKKLFFRVAKKETEIEVGSTLINNQKYTFIKKPLEPWVSFDGKHFKMDPERTFEEFEYKSLLKKSELAKLKDFKNATFTIAVNPQLKKKCLSFNQGPWACK